MGKENDVEDDDFEYLVFAFLTTGSRPEPADKAAAQGGEKSAHLPHWILFIEYFFNLKTLCVGKIFLIEYFKAPIEYFSIPHQVDSHICKIQYFHSLSVPFNLSSLSIYLFQEIWHNISEYQCPARVGFGQLRSEKWRKYLQKSLIGGAL